MPEIDPAATAWLLASTALVLLMTPGLAIFYGGMVRTTGVLNMIMMSFISIPLVHRGLAVGRLHPRVLRATARGGLIGDLSHFGMLGIDPSTAHGAVPELLFATFQLSLRDRHRRTGQRRHRRPREVLGVDGLRPAVDRRGVCGGRALGVGAGRLAVQARRTGLRRRTCRRNRLRRFGIGAGTGARSAHRIQEGRRCARTTCRSCCSASGLLWFGWFGFNAGSALAANGTAAAVFLNTLVAGCLGMLGWIAVERIRDGRPTTFGAASGVVAGLVAITPSCGTVNTLGAVVVGPGRGDRLLVRGRAEVPLGLRRLVGRGRRALRRWRRRCAADRIARHRGHDRRSPGSVLRRRIRPTGQAGAGGTRGRPYAFAVSFVLAKVIDRVMGFRVSAEDETAGVDFTQHAETAYAEGVHGHQPSRRPPSAASARWSSGQTPPTEVRTRRF